MTLEQKAIALIAETNTLAEAKTIIRDIRKTANIIEAKYGPHHSTTKEFWERYYTYEDEVMMKYSRTLAA